MFGEIESNLEDYIDAAAEGTEGLKKTRPWFFAGSMRGVDNYEGGKYQDWIHVPTFEVAADVSLARVEDKFEEKANELRARNPVEWVNIFQQAF